MILRILRKLKYFFTVCISLALAARPEKSRKSHAVSSDDESDAESPSTSAQAKVTNSEA